MDIKVCANPPCGEKFTSAGKLCECCNTKAKREEQVILNKKIVEERYARINQISPDRQADKKEA
jgi:hypothetical protein